MWYLQNGSVSRQPLGHVPSKVQTLLHFCFMLLPMRHWWPPKSICYCNYLRGREGEIPQMKDWKTIFLIISCHLWLRNAGMKNSCNSWGKLANRVPSGHQDVTMLAYVADFPSSVSCILKLLLCCQETINNWKLTHLKWSPSYLIGASRMGLQTERKSICDVS